MRLNVSVNAKADIIGQITTARLPPDTRNRLVALARVKNKTKSEIIIEALEMYYKQEENEIDSYTLGLPYFGNHSLGDGDLSTTYKQRIKENLRAKQNSY
ncbi:MAG: ribbon-helix-helix domain-containing protein [Treponema sp.]|jgi:predicted DNA-binding protein|nr:ribbon-helix-helix domain-containing protein [Treponema sp.]